MKKIAIIGAGISGLFLANLFKKNINYNVTIYEKNSSIDLDEGYGIQLSPNSIKLLNNIGFNNLSQNEKFNPEKIDFYEIRYTKKICSLNISNYNSENSKYTTLKRFKLVEFLKNKLDENIIKYNHNITKIESDAKNIILTFNNEKKTIFDYLVISDGVFSKSKSLISNNKINFFYNNSIAIRGNISGNNLNNLNKKNISLFLGPNFHYVLYPVSNNNKDFNFIGILKHKLTKTELDNYNLFNEKSFIQVVKDKLKNKTTSKIFDDISDIKILPVFISKDLFKSKDNIFLVGDAFFASPPSFAQGASQSIEGAFELFYNIVNHKNDYYKNRAARVKMVNKRSKINQFAFHLSNPILIFFRNIILKMLTKNKNFLENYIGKIYKN